MTSRGSTPPPLGAWAPWHPREVAARLAGVDSPWYVAGGWAVDLWLGVVTRDHADIEIAVPRGSFPAVRARLVDCGLWVAGLGEVAALGAEVPADRRQVWVRDPVEPVWRLDVMLEPGDGGTWVYRRDARVRRRYREMVATTSDGVPYLRPEGVLLDKAPYRRPKDDADLAVALPEMDSAARRWLVDALTVAHPGHPWLTVI
ncbi:MAG TPA: hypothetical protein VF054_01745 [Micromonosporaceae bacterium]